MAIKPRGQVQRSNQPKRAYAKIGEPQFEIAAWCPDDEAKAPPEQVHFIVHWPFQLRDLPPLTIRFKSPDTLGFFIEELIKYRRTVWPDSKKVTGE
jgi:hypothetical protein